VNIEKISPAEIQDILAKTSAFIAEATSRKDFKVLVHDWEGSRQSAVLIVAHIMQTRRISFDAATELVRKTRPGINIEDSYEVQLLQLEQDMHLMPIKNQNVAARGHIAGADSYDYGSDMDDTHGFDQTVRDSSSSDGFLDTFGSNEGSEYEDYEDDDGSHFWGYESYDGEEEDNRESKSLSAADSGSSSDEYWWGHVETNIGAEEAFDEGEDDDLNTFLYFEDEDDFIGSSDEDISVLPKE